MGLVAIGFWLLAFGGSWGLTLLSKEGLREVSAKLRILAESSYKQQRTKTINSASAVFIFSITQVSLLKPTLYLLYII